MNISQVFLGQKSFITVMVSFSLFLITITKSGYSADGKETDRKSSEYLLIGLVGAYPLLTPSMTYGFALNQKNHLNTGYSYNYAMGKSDPKWHEIFLGVKGFWHKSNYLGLSLSARQASYKNRLRNRSGPDRKPAENTDFTLYSPESSAEPTANFLETTLGISIEVGNLWDFKRTKKLVLIEWINIYLPLIYLQPTKITKYDKELVTESDLKRAKEQRRVLSRFLRFQIGFSF